MHKRRRLELRDLVLVALLSAVGGVLSTYVGYLGNLINRAFGVPFGAGQLVAGVHVLWPVLARALIGRFGSGTLTGTIKGLVEFLSGGTHGVVILLVSVVQGFLVDVGMSMSSRRRLGVMMLSAGVASASNVFVFQALYFSNIPVSLLLGMAGLALISGTFLGGYLAWDLHTLLRNTHLVHIEDEATTSRAVGRRWRRHALTLAIVLVSLAGAAYYYIETFDPFSAADTVRVEGAVTSPYTYRRSEWDGEETTITAALRGAVTTAPEQAYRGPLLRDIVHRARPVPAASGLRVIASDGYEIRLEWSRVQADDELILTLDNDGTLRLVAAGYDGSFWVQRVRRLVVD